MCLLSAKQPAPLRAVFTSEEFAAGFPGSPGSRPGRAGRALPCSAGLGAGLPAGPASPSLFQPGQPLPAGPVFLLDRPLPAGPLRAAPAAPAQRRRPASPRRISLALAIPRVFPLAQPKRWGLPSFSLGLLLRNVHSRSAPPGQFPLFFPFFVSAGTTGRGLPGSAAASPLARPP